MNEFVRDDKRTKIKKCQVEESSEISNQALFLFHSNFSW